MDTIKVSTVSDLLIEGVSFETDGSNIAGICSDYAHNGASSIINLVTANGSFRSRGNARAAIGFEYDASSISNVAELVISNRVFIVNGEPGCEGAISRGC
jgi:hypothetical protein